MEKYLKESELLTILENRIKKYKSFSIPYYYRKLAECKELIKIIKNLE